VYSRSTGAGAALGLAGVASADRRLVEAGADEVEDDGDAAEADEAVPELLAAAS